MAEHRTVPAGRGLAWITDAFAVLRRGHGTYLGACLFAGLLASMPLIGLLPSAAMPVLQAGLLSLLRTCAGGGRGRAGQLFDGFTQPGAFVRLLPIALFNLGFVLALFAVLGIAAGPELDALAREAQAGGKPDPGHVLAVFRRMVPPALAMMPLAAFVNWMLMLAIPRAMLDGVPGGVALREAAGAVWANLGAFVANLF
ncbi:MAG TPA: hypothetical protein VFY71_10935, partial [Planctomycetota bacterium]|nr:hypothetical protein [Planctomycetota bacterium]